MLVTALGALGFFQLSNQAVTGNPPTRNHVPQTKSTGRDRIEDTDFWKSARIPASPHFREPIMIHPIDLGVREPQSFDHAQRVRELAQSDDCAALNYAVSEWFAADPARARDWIAEQTSLSPIQTALRHIADHIANEGDCALALKWASLLEKPEDQQRALVSIHTTGFRIGLFDRATIEAAAIPECERTRILNGSAGD